MSDREAQLERCLEEAALYKAQVEAGFRVLREALEWIMFRAEAAISGPRSIAGDREDMPAPPRGGRMTLALFVFLITFVTTLSVMGSGR